MRSAISAFHSIFASPRVSPPKGFLFSIHFQFSRNVFSSHNIFCIQRANSWREDTWRYTHNPLLVVFQEWKANPRILLSFVIRAFQCDLRADYFFSQNSSMFIYVNTSWVKGYFQDTQVHYKCNILSRLLHVDDETHRFCQEISKNTSGFIFCLCFFSKMLSVTLQILGRLENRYYAVLLSLKLYSVPFLPAIVYGIS